MSNLAYFTLDALLVCFAIAIIWVFLKKFLSLFKSTHKVARHSLRVLSKSHSPNDRVVISKRVERVRGLNDFREKQSTLSTLVRTIPLTKFQESQDWSLYDTPTYLRNGIVIH